MVKTLRALGITLITMVALSAIVDPMVGQFTYPEEYKIIWRSF